MLGCVYIQPLTSKKKNKLYLDPATHFVCVPVQVVSIFIEYKPHYEINLGCNYPQKKLGL
jgi:hypothetical protein